MPRAGRPLARQKPASTPSTDVSSTQIRMIRSIVPSASQAVFSALSASAPASRSTSASAWPLG